MKILKRFLLPIAVTALLLLSLAGCDEACAHSNTRTVSEVVDFATCTEDGSYFEILKCADCGEELWREEKVQPKLPHTHGTPTVTNEQSATCTEEGSYDEVTRCTVCSDIVNVETKKTEKLPHVPTAPVRENEVGSTCTEEGSYDEVVYCECGEELQRTEKTVPKEDHVPSRTERENEVGATEESGGSYDEVVYCECGEEISRTHKETPKLDHTPRPKDPVRENEVGATCTAEGSYDEVVYCECGEELSRTTKTIPMEEHTHDRTARENEVGATCTVEGSYDEVVYCKCGAEVSRTGKKTPVTEHAPFRTERENEIPSTEQTKGSYDEVVYCKCGEELSRVTYTIPTAEHESKPLIPVRENEVGATCTSEGSYDEVVYCECGEELSREHKIIPKNDHAPAEYKRENEVATSCEHPGSYDEVIYCICGHELSRNTVPVAQLPHSETVDRGYAATETKDGLTDGVSCSSCGTVIKPQTVIPATLQGTEIRVEGLVREGNALSLTVSGSVTGISLTDKIFLNATSSYRISYTEQGTESVEQLILGEGNNSFFITVTDKNGATEIYTLSVYRKYTYTVTFLTNGGGDVEPQKIEEGGLISAPTVSKTGYTLVGWSYNFSTPVTSNITVSAIWMLNSYTVSANDGALGSVTGAGKYDYNTFLSLTAVPGVNSVFVGWYMGGDCISASLSVAVHITDNITAVFERVTDGLIINGVKVPYYSGEPKVNVNGGIPFFTYAEKTGTTSHYNYTDLDSLGRSGAAWGCLSRDTMPTDDRESISHIKPSGWEYNGVPNNKYYPTIEALKNNTVYNRAHLLGHQLVSGDVDVRNFVTGTRSMNQTQMVPFENLVADYIKETGGHVMYRVTPVFEGDNLICTGVLMEGWSVEDDGESVMFCVFIYNVEPGVSINYLTGENQLAQGEPDDPTPENPPVGDSVNINASINGSLPGTLTYVGGTAAFYADGGLKLNVLGHGVKTILFTPQSSVTVTITINALNQNSKTDNAAKDAFTIVGLDANGNAVVTVTLDSVVKGENSVTLTGTGIAAVQVTMTDYPTSGGKCCNVSLGGISVTNGSGSTGGDPTPPTPPVEPDEPDPEPDTPVTPPSTDETTEVEFDFGANGSANTHDDGKDIGTGKTYTSGGYELIITDATKVYGGGYDKANNSIIKLGTSSAAATFTFVVPDGVNYVVIYAARYKSYADNNVIVINGVKHTLTKNSDDGQYEAITVDTSTNKTVVVATTTEGTKAPRAVIDKIVFITSGTPSVNPDTPTVPDTPTEPDEPDTPTEPDEPEVPDTPAVGSAELSFSDTANRTEFNSEKQVWKQNGVTVTNNKSGSSNVVADYANPARFYAKSEIIIECAGMRKITFNCSTTEYAKALAASIGTGATQSGTTVTVEFSAAQSSFTIASLTAQVRINSIKVES